MTACAWAGCWRGRSTKAELAEMSVYWYTAEDQDKRLIEAWPRAAKRDRATFE